jgi:excisionase family DNA binding protein
VPYVGIKAAAERLGVSQDTIRRRIKAGELEGQQEPMGSGFRWLVEVPEEAQASPADDREPGAAAADALELAALRERVEGLERLLSEVSADRDAWKDQARRSQVMAETAQRLAEGAQALALPAGEPDTGNRAPDASAGDTTPSAPRESLRERLRRLWHGA